MIVEERLLGFDVREMWLDLNVLWTQERKDTYLLRTDINKVLSTDTLVWPSAFEWDNSIRSSFRNTALNLWCNLQQLRDQMDSMEYTAQKPYWIIGITLLWGIISSQEQEMWNSFLLPTIPPAPDKDWTFLGYDVADTALISGLSNCSHKPDEIQSMRERWGPHLNRFHLFRDYSQAVEFKRESDQRVVEHAPFFVYGLYLVEG